MGGEDNGYMCHENRGESKEPAERVGVLGRAVGGGEDVGGSVIFKPLQREQC